MGDATRLQIVGGDPEALAPHVYAFAVERGWKLRELAVQRQTLEDLFVRVTEPENAAVPVNPPLSKASSDFSPLPSGERGRGLSGVE